MRLENRAQYASLYDQLERVVYLIIMIRIYIALYHEAINSCHVSNSISCSRRKQFNMFFNRINESKQISEEIIMIQYGATISLWHNITFFY